MPLFYALLKVFAYLCGIIFAFYDYELNILIAYEL